MPQKSLQMSPGTESIIRASFAKGFYYNDEENFLKCVEILLPFDEDKKSQISEILGQYRQSMADMKDIKDDVLSSRAGEIYLTVRNKADYLIRLRDIRQESHRLRTILTSFVITTMEKKEILKEEFTVMKLTKLPLTLRGIKGMKEQTDDEDEDYEDY